MIAVPAVPIGGDTVGPSWWAMQPDANYSPYRMDGSSDLRVSRGSGPSLFEDQAGLPSRSRDVRTSNDFVSLPFGDLEQDLALLADGQDNQGTRPRILSLTEREALSADAVRVRGSPLGFPTARNELLGIVREK